MSLMVLFNLLMAASVACGAYAWWRTRKLWLLALPIGMVLVYTQLQPAYMPKGHIERTPIPAAGESTAATIEDRVPRPDTLQERDQRMKDAVQSGLDFK